MFRKVAASFVLVALTSVGSAMAADEVVPAPGISNSLAASASEVTTSALFEAPKVTSRGALLPSLYVGLASLNAYDAYTTTKGVARGATESNGLLRGAAGSPAAMWAIKGGVTAGSILLSEQLWKSGHRAQAIGMMVAANSVMAMVGARNSSVLRNQR